MASSHSSRHFSNSPFSKYTAEGGQSKTAQCFLKPHENISYQVLMTRVEATTVHSQFKADITFSHLYVLCVARWPDTCFVGDVGHVGRVVFDGLLVMFQCHFKVFILICRIAKFLFLQGLSEEKEGGCDWKIKGSWGAINHTRRPRITLQWEEEVETDLPAACFLEGPPPWGEAAGSLWVWVQEEEERAPRPFQRDLCPATRRVWSSPWDLAVSCQARCSVASVKL